MTLHETIDYQRMPFSGREQELRSYEWVCKHCGYSRPMREHESPGYEDDAGKCPNGCDE